jgi:hypothetical protein
MATVLALLSLLAWTLLVLLALAAFAETRARRRWRRAVAQVRVTEAVDRELGTIAAPVVARRPGGAWTVSIALGPRELAAAGRLTAIARSVLGEDGTPVHVVIEPTPGRPPRVPLRRAA